MAAELGRMEQKAELSLRIQSQQPTTDLLRELMDELLTELVIDQIFGLFDGAPGGEYQLTPSCPVPAGEDPPVPWKVSWGESGDAIEDIVKRLDALAVLIQYHKDQPQPNCKTASQRGNVTVHFSSDS